MLRGVGILFGSQEGTFWDLCEKVNSESFAKYRTPAVDEEIFGMEYKDQKVELSP